MQRAQNFNDTFVYAALFVCNSGVALAFAAAAYAQTALAPAYPATPQFEWRAKILFLNWQIFRIYAINDAPIDRIVSETGSLIILSVQFWQSYITKTAETAGHPGAPCYLLFSWDGIVEYQSLGPDPSLPRARDARGRSAEESWTGTRPPTLYVL